MLLSRFWYVLLSFLFAGSLYVVFVAVGQYNRRNTVAMSEELASDSQVLGWALQIDARRRLDALLLGSVDKGIQESLLNANGKDKIPAAAREGARKALAGIADKIPADFKEDALFAVDRDGRVVAQLGFDIANAYDDFELGGYPAVFDALHGYLRDDTWVLGGKIYRVVARPVEFDVTQPPAGAVVGLRSVDNRFAQELSKRTRTNVAFYAAGQRVAAATAEGFDSQAMDLLAADVANLNEDPTYADGRSDVHPLGKNLGAIYARLPGDAWELGAGFGVIRAHPFVTGPLGFLTGADDKDKANVSWPILGAALLLGALIGIVLSLLEHTRPLKALGAQAAALKKGTTDFLQVPRLGGALRAIAQDINGGIERIVERGGGPGRRPADLESILGPAPAQPAMSAFAFPLDGNVTAPSPGAHPGPPAGRPGSGLGAAPPPPASVQTLPGGPGPRSSTGPGSSLGIGGLSPASGGPPLGRPPAPSPSGRLPMTPVAGSLQATKVGMAPAPPASMAAFAPPDRPSAPRGMNGPRGAQPPSSPNVGRGFGGRPTMPHPPLGAADEDSEEATMVGAVPAEVLAAATGEYGAGEETAEWLVVYRDFVRTKGECGESTEGLTFEKFQQTLKKNRDQLIARHGCKKVRFSVYVKEGRASLKATPVKD